MALKADRYSMLKVHFNDLAERIEAIHSLDMKWFCVRCNSESRSCELYIFFDNDGLQNYLTRVYGFIEDRQRKILAQFRAGDLTAEKTISEWAATLDY